MQPVNNACDHVDGDDEAVLVIKGVEAECGDGDDDHACMARQQVHRDHYA